MLKQGYTLPIILNFDSDQERESQRECKTKTVSTLQYPE